MLEVIKILHSNEFLGCGKFTEIAKGKNEQVFTIKESIKKVKRAWHKLRR